MAVAKNALVTGAGKRIGKAIALALAESGYNIALHYRSSRAEAKDVADEVQKSGVKAACIKADLAVETETAALIGAAKDALGPMTLLVNSASRYT